MNATEKNEVTKYSMGWICLRTNRVGRASKMLLADGWMRQSRAQINNRIGTDWSLPCVSREKFSREYFAKLESAGLSGLAIWITDAQWSKNMRETDAQWHNRIVIG